jgi:hypothetical protein
MPTKAIIARLEQHFDDFGRLTLRPTELLPVSDQAGSARQLLLQMVQRKRINEQRRDQEFNQLRARMTVQRNPSVARDQVLSNLCASFDKRQAAPNKPGAWWRQASEKASHVEGMAQTIHRSAFASTMAESA